MQWQCGSDAQVENKAARAALKGFWGRSLPCAHRLWGDAAVALGRLVQERHPLLGVRQLLTDAHDLPCHCLRPSSHLSTLLQGRLLLRPAAMPTFCYTWTKSTCFARNDHYQQRSAEICPGRLSASDRGAAAGQVDRARRGRAAPQPLPGGCRPGTGRTAGRGCPRWRTPAGR